MSLPPSPLFASPSPNNAAFARRIATLLPAWTVQWLPGTGSTNLDMQGKVRDALAHWHGPLLLGADVQTAGRGRAGRPWRTAPGDALLFSCGLRCTLPASALPPLSIIAGLAAAEALNRLLPATVTRRVSVKWPNDLFWGEGKLAGILPEVVSQAAAQRAHRDQIGLVVGMGMNLRGAAALSAHLQRPVADWSGTDSKADAATLVAAIASSWLDAFDLYEAQGFRAFSERFRALDALADREVRVLDHDKVLLEGTACGLDDWGRLLITTADGTVPVTVGDVSVRPTPQADR